MASNTSISRLGSKPHPTDADAQPIVLHVVSPSFDAQRRITFNDLPLSTTISEVKAKITQELPSRPPPESQRLIYRGKPLSDNNQVLKHIVEPSDTLVYSMHLVLPPSTSTIPSLKPKGTSSASGVLSESDTRPNSLRYRSSQAINETTPKSQATGHISPRGAYTVPRLNAQENTQSQSQDAASNGTTPSHHSHQLNATTSIWGGVGQSTRTLHDSHSSPAAITSPNNLGSMPPTGNPPVSNRPLSQPLRPLLDQHLQHRRSHNGTAEVPLPVQRTASYPPAQPVLNHRPSTTTLDSESRRYQLALVVRNIITMESQLQAGIIPRVDEISAARSQLYQHLDEQHRSLLEPRDVPIEKWITRVSILATRADQLRLMRARNSNSSSSQRTASAPPSISHHIPYFVLSPSGHQGVILPPTNSFPASVSRATTTHFLPPAIPFTSNGISRHINVNRPLNPALLRVRRRHSVVIRGATLVKVVRALWLFIRLYFFCYILSDSGTWLRLFLVTLSVAWACLSETDIPQQIRRAIFTPLRRHVEGLLPAQPGPTQPPRGRQDADNLQGGRAPRASPGADQPTNEEAPQDRNAHTGFLQRNRDLERGIALFFASLVPGISEQQIAAMNAANAVRENEERTRREQQDQAAQQDSDADAHEEPDLQAEQMEGHHDREDQPLEL